MIDMIGKGLIVYHSQEGMREMLPTQPKKFTVKMNGGEGILKI